MPTDVSIANANYTNYEALKNSLINLTGNEGRLKLDGDAIVADTRKKNFFSIFKWKTENQQIDQSTRNLGEKLKDAMVEKFGHQVGLSIFNTYIKSKVDGKQGISTRDVQNMFSVAVQLEEMLSKVMLNLNPNDKIPISKEIQNVFKQANVPMNLARHVLARATSSMEPCSHDYQSLASKKIDIDNSLKELTKLNDTLKNANMPINLKAASMNVVKNLEAHINELQTLQGEISTELQKHPLKKENVIGAANDIFINCKTVLNDLMHEYAENAPKLARLRDCDIFLGNMKDDLITNLGSKDSISADDISHIKDISKKFAGQLAKITGGFRATKKILKRIANASKDNLEQKEWKVIEKPITVITKGKNVKVNSTMTPACKMLSIGRELSQDGINGVVCSDQSRPNHAVNLWKTECTHQGKVLYSGLRHGVNSAYGIKNERDRIAANNNRAKDIYTAAIVNNPTLLEMAKSGKVVDLNIVSTSLLTPEVFRSNLPFFSRSSHERTMLQEQANSWKGACDRDGICHLDITDADGKVFNIKVRPQVLQFNYGVNQGAQSANLKPLFSGWNMSESMNKTAITSLIGDPRREGIGGIVGNYYAQCTDQAKKAKIETLVQQIKDIHNSGGYKLSGEDPFRLPARINLLAYLCDLTPCFNCKSGKDRTGQLDVSTKELAISLEMGGGTTSLSTVNDRERKMLLNDIALQSGNLEVQEYNTGMAGFKLKGIEAIKTIYGKSNEAFVGLSSAVKA